MENLHKIIKYLEDNDCPVVRLIQKGLTKSEIWKKLSEKGLEPTADIENLYQAINGTRESEDYLGLQYFFPWYLMCPLEKSLEIYEEECDIDTSFPKGFIPIFWDGNRDYLLVDCLNKTEGVYLFSLINFMMNGLIKKYDSVDSLLSTVLKCFEKGAYQLGRSLEDIKINNEIERKISKEMNPNSEFWDLIEDNLTE